MAKLHGKNGAIYLGGGIGSGTLVSFKTDWTLNRNRDTVDATVFGDTNKTYLVGLPDIQGTYAGFLDTSGDAMLTASTQDAQLIYLYADVTGTPVEVAHGSGFIDASVTCSHADGVKMTGNFRAQGAWTISI